MHERISKNSDCYSLILCLQMKAFIWLIFSADMVSSSVLKAWIFLSEMMALSTDFKYGCMCERGA